MAADTRARGRRHLAGGAMDDLVRAVARWLHGWDLGHSQQPYPEDYEQDARELLGTVEVVPRSALEAVQEELLGSTTQIATEYRAEVKRLEAEVERLRDLLLGIAEHVGTGECSEPDCEGCKYEAEEIRRLSHEALGDDLPDYLRMTNPAESSSANE